MIAYETIFDPNSNDVDVRNLRQLYNLQSWVNPYWRETINGPDMENMKQFI